MKKRIGKKVTLVLVFLVAAGGGAALVYAQNRHSTSTSRVQVIELTSTKASPSEITLKVGERIEFDSQDGQNYQIAQGEDETSSTHNHSTSTATSPVFGKGEGYLVSFPQPGTYYFHDHLHTSLNILVVVYQPTTN